MIGSKLQLKQPSIRRPCFLAKSRGLGISITKTPLDFARKEARRIEGLLELELGSDHPFFIAFRSADTPGTTIVYHTPGGTSVGYAHDNLAVGSIAVELCEPAKVSFE